MRIVELAGGLRHYRTFAEYLATGGIDGILADPRICISSAKCTVFWHGCRQIAFLDRQEEAAGKKERDRQICSRLRDAL